jgi:glycosyltransferase involved in cell wall biosynthesis
MNILLLSNSDINGGAARAAYRLHTGLKRIGLTSHMLVQEKASSDSTVIAPRTRLAEGIARARIAFDVLPLKAYPKRQKATFSVQWLPDTVDSQVSRLQPDLINLHWINQGFIRLENLAKFKRPLVWSLHDMWAFTGGCHYNQNCDRYTESCGACPHLGSQQERDLSRQIWQRKSKAWATTNLTIVALSSWMAECARSSSLFKNLRIECIPNGLDTTLYRPIPRQIAREVLGLPQEKQLLLSGSLNVTGDKRKGFHLLQPALQNLSQAGWQDQLELVIFGASQPEQTPEVGLKVHYLGTLNDDISLALAYTAADVFVAPSLQDNLPNTIMEAIACGTPCVAFNIGGMPDMIEHQINGYLAKDYDIQDLAQGIVWVLENQERHQKLSYYARQKAKQEFTLEIQAHRYSALFSEILRV